MSTSEDIFDRLQAPFPIQSVKWRAGATNNKDNPTKAIALAYIDARDVMQRLDDVLGFAGWQNTHEVSGNAFTCSIGIKIGKEWLWKTNGAGETNFEGVKGGLSDSFKRAGVLWGIGRYLYDLPTAWVSCEKRGRSVILTETPPLPGWACPNDKVEKKLWTKPQRDAVANYAPSVNPEQLNAFLDMTGLPESIKTKFVEKFARLYQGHYVEHKNKSAALKHAKENWNKEAK